MKLLSLLYMASVFLFANIIGMEKQHTEVKTSMALQRRPAMRTAIEDLCLKFANGKVSLDELFSRVFPSEITCLIINIAYGNNLRKYFYSKNRCINFFESRSYFRLTNIDRKIKSWSNEVDRYNQYAQLKGLTCATTLKNGCIAAGFDSGTIGIFNPNTQNLDNRQTKHTSPITAFAKIRKSGKQFLMAGHQDGSLSLFTKKRIAATCPKLFPVSISCIAPVQNDSDLYILGGENLIGLVAMSDVCTDNEEPFIRSCFFRLRGIKGADEVIAGVGLNGNNIIVKTTMPQLFVISLYGINDRRIIKRCAFSPSQASCIHHMIQEERADTRLEPSDAEIEAFRTLSPTMQRLLTIERCHNAPNT